MSNEPRQGPGYMRMRAMSIIGLSVKYLIECLFDVPLILLIVFVHIWGKKVRGPSKPSNQGEEYSGNFMPKVKHVLIIFLM